MNRTRVPIWRLLLWPLGAACLIAGEADPVRGAEPANRPVRTDQYGDPLPPGAVARLGTVRWLHDNPIVQLAYSPNGRQVATTDERGVLHVWEQATGKLVSKFGDDPAQKVVAFVFAPQGRLLAAVEGRVAASWLSIWDVTARKKLAEIESCCEVYCAAFTPDGRTLAVVKALLGGGCFIWLHEAETGKRLHQLSGHEDSVFGVTFSADGRRLASAGKDGEARFWDVATGACLRTFAKAPESPIALTPDGRRLLAVERIGNEFAIVCWDTTTGAEQWRVDDYHAERLLLALSPDGKHVVDNGVSRDEPRKSPFVGRVRSLASGKEVSRLAAHGTSCLYQAAFAPDGRTLAGVGGAAPGDCTEASRNDGLRVRFWDAQTGAARPAEAGMCDQVLVHAFTRDGLILATADGKACLCDPCTGRVVQRLAIGDPAGFSSEALTLSPDGRLLAVQEGGVGLVVWDTKTGKLLYTLGSQHRCAFTPDSKHLVSAIAREGAALHVWDAATGKELRSWGTGQGQLEFLHIASGGRTLLTACGDGTVSVWDLATGKERWRPRLQDGCVLACSADGGLLAYASRRDPSLKILDTVTGQVVQSFDDETADWMHAHAVFSPDGRTLAILQGHSQRVLIWELSSRLLRHDFTIANPNSSGVAFSPDSRRLVTSSFGRPALVWDLRDLLDADAPPARLAAEKLPVLWNDLADARSPKGMRAIRDLTAFPTQAVPFLSERLQPVPPPNARQLAQLVADLDAEQFAVRQRATEELERLGELAHAALVKVLEDRPSLEVRRRIEGLLDKTAASLLLAAPLLQVVRAIEILEQIGTREARAVLQRLAEGAPGARVTRDAQAALERLAQRVGAAP